ncbi:hypothetical protein WMF30_38175 [Sorangium sp. So ce134]
MAERPTAGSRSTEESASAEATGWKRANEVGRPTACNAARNGAVRQASVVEEHRMPP